MRHCVAQRRTPHASRGSAAGLAALAFTAQPHLPHLPSPKVSQQRICAGAVGRGSLALLGFIKLRLPDPETARPGGGVTLNHRRHVAHGGEELVRGLATAAPCAVVIHEQDPARRQPLPQDLARRPATTATAHDQQPVHCIAKARRRG
eukprot:scaffold704_cov347-Prasinococcus_capsulatus_cf.AAC.27